MTGKKTSKTSSTRAKPVKKASVAKKKAAPAKKTTAVKKTAARSKTAPVKKTPVKKTTASSKAAPAKKTPAKTAKKVIPPPKSEASPPAPTAPNGQKPLLHRRPLLVFPK